MTTSYEPRPIPVEHVVIGAQLAELTETLAEHSHDTWSLQRLRDGWTYGPRRDDMKRQHPCLVPYNALTEEEKHYDRVIVVGLVRAIIALGFTISREPESSA
jgi:hypothetical protein